MSIEAYKEAKTLIQRNSNLADFVGEREIEVIQLAEEVLGLKFDGMYLDYLQKYGAGNFGSQEIYGIIGDNFETSSVPDAVWYTLTERKSINLPSNLFIIYDTGLGELLCLDFEQLSNYGEPVVVSFMLGVDLKDQTFKVVAEDFGELLLELVTQEIESN